MQGSPTLQEIADACGVTKTTVSLALRNHPRISVTTRTKILEAAKRMGHHLNPLVSAHMAHLRSTRAPRYQATIAFVCNWPKHLIRGRNSHINRFFNGAKSRAGELGYVLDSFYLDEPNMTARRLDDVLQARGIAGIVVAPLFKPEGKLNLTWSRYAAVALGYSLTEPDLNRACHDNYATMLRAIKRLRKLGYQKIGLAMAASDDIRVRNLWLAGYYVHYHSREKPRAVPPCVPSEWTKDVFMQWIRKHSPDAVISTSAQAHGWLVEEGFRIPEELGFVTVAASGNEISGFDQDFELIGTAAVEKVTALLQRYDIGIPDKPRIVLVEGRWIQGRTVRTRND